MFALGKGPPNQARWEKIMLFPSYIQYKTKYKVGMVPRVATLEVFKVN